MNEGNYGSTFNPQREREEERSGVRVDRHMHCITDIWSVFLSSEI